MLKIEKMEIEKIFKALQCPTRLQILEKLSDGREYTTKEISDELGIKQSITLRHLEELESVGFLKSFRHQPGVGRPGKKFKLDVGRCRGMEFPIGNLKIVIDINLKN